jgi:glycosyltransferase involved in cell wall biosynthesis
MLAQALWQLISDERRRSAMGKLARRHVAAHFTVERMCTDTIALYRELLAREN